jgi:hypothetical protein
MLAGYGEIDWQQCQPSERVRDKIAPGSLLLLGSGTVLPLQQLSYCNQGNRQQRFGFQICNRTHGEILPLCRDENTRV